MRRDELERLVMELQDERLQREAIERYKRERFLFWKDVALVAGAVIGGLLGIIGFVRTL